MTMVRKPKLPKVISQVNAEKVMEQIRRLPCMQPGKHEESCPDWVYQEVDLEVPTGELVRDGLQTMALVGRSSYRHADLTGKEGFDAQGLEGKVVIRKPLLNALFNLDLVGPGRGRIVTGRSSKR